MAHDTKMNVAKRWIVQRCWSWLQREVKSLVANSEKCNCVRLTIPDTH